MSSTKTLSYVSFFILYVICFVYMFREMSGIIALGALTIVHTAFTMFAGNEISSKLLNMSVDGPNTIITTIALLSIFVSSAMNVSALVLIMLLLTSLQKKYNETVGTPVVLPPEYQEEFDSFKTTFIATFVLGCALLYLLAFKRFEINKQLDNLTAPSMITLLISLTITGLSIKQVVRSSSISELKNRSVVGR